jgi:hypothetical protein
MTATETKPRLAMPRISWGLGAVLFAGIAVFFLWEEHEAHFLGALPWLLLLACPLLHLFMHRGHGQGGVSGHRGHHQH